MASGLSMASVNKIKELAAAGQYDMAAPILDTQELEKSLNPQFIRICGEVYENVNRLEEARRFYVRAHIMAPESNRIIFSIITFYLKMGYFTLAKQYQKEYLFNDNGNERNISNIEYVMKKAEGEAPDKLYGKLFPYYIENIDEYWSYELYLLAKIIDRKDAAKTIADDYLATFKENKKRDIITAIEAGMAKPEDYFYTFAKEEVPDKLPIFEEIREMEKHQLEADFKRIDPDEDEVLEPQFLTMVDDEFDIPGEEKEKDSKKGKKNIFGRLLKIKGERDILDDDEPDDFIDDSDDDVAKEESAVVSSSDEKAVSDSEKNDSADEDIELSTQEPEPEAETPEDEYSFDVEDDYEPKSIDDVITYDYDDGFAPESDTIEGLGEISEDDFVNTYDIDELQSKFSQANEDFEVSQFKDDSYEAETEEEFAEETPAEAETFETAEISEISEEKISEIAEAAKEETVSEVEEVVEETPAETETVETAEISEIADEKISEIAEAAKEEAISELAEDAAEEAVSEVEEISTIEDAEETPAETETVETAEIAEEKISEITEVATEEAISEVEEISTIEDAEETPAEPEAVETPEIEAETISEVAEVAEETPVKPETIVSHEETGVMVAPPPIAEPDISSYPLADSVVPAEEGSSIKVEVAEEGVRVADADTASYVPAVESTDEQIEETVEEATEGYAVESADEQIEETVEEAAEEYAAEPADEQIEETATDQIEENDVDKSDESSEKFSVFDKYKDLSYEVEETGGMAFPKFRNTLFPDIDKEEHVIVNKFDDVAKAEEEKLKQRLLEEERMQREAEELLKSLGIDI